MPSLVAPLRSLWRTPLAREAAAAVAAALVWYWSSSGVTDVLLWGAFIYGLFHWRELAAFWWRNAPAFVVLIAALLLLLPLSTSPYLSARDMIKVGKAVAAAAALPCVLGTPPRVRCALRWSATVLTVILAADLLRLLYLCGGDVVARGRFQEPFVLNHPNVASIMAGLCFWVWAFLAWRARARPVACAGALAAAAFSVVYLVALASRGPQTGFAASLAALPFLLPGRKLKAAAALSCVLIAVFVAANAQSLFARWLEKSSMKNFSARTIVWRHSLKLAGERPLLGHGYGKKVFLETYQSSAPPRSPFKYPHAHEYWLKIYFENGVPGVALYGAAWAALGVRLLRAIARHPRLDDRALPMLCALMLVCIHVYGLGDFPDGIVEFALIALVPLTLVVTRRDATDGEPA